MVTRGLTLLPTQTRETSEPHHLRLNWVLRWEKTAPFAWIVSEKQTLSNLTTVFVSQAPFISSTKARYHISTTPAFQPLSHMQWPKTKRLHITRSFHHAQKVYILVLVNNIIITGLTSDYWRGNHFLPAACNGACTGLNTCTSPTSTGCCNVNAAGQCRDTCPSTTMPDGDFICSKHHSKKALNSSTGWAGGGGYYYLSQEENNLITWVKSVEWRVKIIVHECHYSTMTSVLNGVILQWGYQVYNLTSYFTNLE